MKIVTEVNVYESLAELSEEDRELVDAAKRVAANAYAPYSHFHVGAAIRMDNGEIVTGANQENAAFPAGTCAERSACFHAGARWPGMPLRKIAVAAATETPEPSTPSTPSTPPTPSTLSDPSAQLPTNHLSPLASRLSYQKKPISPCGICRQALLEFETRQGAPIEVLLYGTERIYALPSVASLLPLAFADF